MASQAGVVQSFSAIVSERVGWYVYALRDPRDNKVFYIGKGKGNRVFQHAQAAASLDGGSEMSPKLDLIRAIHDSGNAVQTYIVRHGLSSEQAAYDVEAAMIDTLRLLDPSVDNDRFTLTNLVLGHHHASRGLASTDVVSSLFEAEPAPDITEPVLLIKIPDLWTPSMSADELYDATRTWWKIGPRRERAKYAFSVNHGVVREVYAIESWRSWTRDECDRPGTVRWGFTGSIATEPEMEHYRNKSVAGLYKRGEASPIKYLNC